MKDNETVTANLHTVDYDADTQQVTFSCAGDEAADCHIWPDDVEYWDSETPRDTFVPHERCWMFDWFDNHAVEYTGENSIEADDSYGNYIPNTSRSGLINTSFRTDFIEWEWA